MSDANPPSIGRTIEQECESLEAEALKGGEYVGITNDLALRLVGAIRTRDAVLRTLCDALDVNCGTATVPQERRTARAVLASGETT